MAETVCDEKDRSDEEEPYFDFCYQLTGPLTDRWRHLITRAALLNELRLDPKTNAFLDDVEKETGIAPFHEAALAATDKFARVLRVDPSQAFKPKLWPPTRSKKVEKTRVIAGTAAVSAIERFGEELEQRADKVAARMAEFVRDDLRLPWPWLAMELTTMSFRVLVGSVFREGYYVEYSLRSEAPVVDRHLFIKAGPKAESVKQLESFYQSALHEILGPSAERRARTPDEAILKRNAVWFYRRVMKGESISTLAREYCESNHQAKAVCAGDRSTVQAGIHECRRVLDLIPFDFVTN